MKGPLFSFFGAKWRAAKYYEPPRFDTIVEMFAGSACYASRYPNRQVILVERDPQIAALWRWLISATPADVLALPEMTADTYIPDLDICHEAKALLGFWCNGGTATPRMRPSARHRNAIFKRHQIEVMWPCRRAAVAEGVKEIKHWILIEGDTLDVCPLIRPATYFVDPPYEKAGKGYRYSEVNYPELATVCNGLQNVGNQVIACEARGATWLPFRDFKTVKASSRAGGRQSHEMVWP